MTEFPSDWSQSKRSKYRILKPAFGEFEGARAILLLQWVRAKQAHLCETEKPTLLDKFKQASDCHLREEALKTARDTDRARALSLFSGAPALPGVRLN